MSDPARLSPRQPGPGQLLEQNLAAVEAARGAALRVLEARGDIPAAVSAMYVALRRLAETEAAIRGAAAGMLIRGQACPEPLPVPRPRRRHRRRPPDGQGTLFPVRAIAALPALAALFLRAACVHVVTVALAASVAASAAHPHAVTGHSPSRAGLAAGMRAGRGAWPS